MIDKAGFVSRDIVVSFPFLCTDREKENKRELVAVVGSLKIISVALNDFELATLGQEIVSGASLR